MGRFLNRGNLDFASARNDEYIDKSSMIQVVNDTLDKPKRFSCVTRCRRFGKSMAAQMLYAYYDKSCDSRHLFEDLAIAKMPSFEEHLNKYPAIFVDMTRFTTVYDKNPDIVKIIQQAIKKDVCSIYPDVMVEESDDLMDTLFAVADQTKERFVMIIDEWDAICREFDKMPEVVNKYVNLLRRLFKADDTNKVFMGVYMTGILPIKRYNTQSALNNFLEYSMIDPASLATYFGFTEEEVATLSAKYNANLDDLKMWYDGYKIGDETSMYNPYSVMLAVVRKKCKSYWQSTSAYDNISDYIQMNYEGLKDDIINMLAGGRCGVMTGSFNNDLKDVRCKDDVLTILIHLGYLSYDPDTQECFVPNMEVQEAMEYAVKDSKWTNIVKAINSSRELLEETINCNETAVANAINAAHSENTSILSYNSENSMACVLAIAYIWAKNDYIIHREYATGKGYADLVLIPRRNSDKPAIIIELKYNTAVNTAIDQIKRKNYPDKVREYSDNLLLVGISYDPKDKVHECRIEKG